VVVDRKIDGIFERTKREEKEKERKSSRISPPLLAALIDCYIPNYYSIFLDWASALLRPLTLLLFCSTWPNHTSRQLRPCAPLFFFLFFCFLFFFFFSKNKIWRICCVSNGGGVETERKTPWLPNTCTLQMRGWLQRPFGFYS
jgi:hypothetical protein